MQYDILMRLNEIYRHGVYAEETLSEEEMLSIEEWVEALIEEGYDLDQFSDEELYEAYLCELNKAEKELGMSSWQAEIGRNKRYKNAHVKPSQRKPDSYFYDKGNLTPDPSSGESTSWHDSMSKARKISRELNREQADLYDIVSEYLVSEGFCDSYEDADVIMANMSEEWRESIVEEVLDEASPTNPNLYKGKHGQTEKEYMDGRSRVGKEISGTSTETGAQRQIDRFNIPGGRTPNRPGERPRQQPNLNYYARDILKSQIHSDHNQGGARISRVTGKMTKYRM